MYIVERKFAESVERKIEILEMEYNQIVKQGVVLENKLQEAACEIYRLREENAKLKEEVEDLENRLIEAAEMADYYD